MAVRGWAGSVATAAGVAAGVSAAQLGLGYGLGIIAWVPAAAQTGDATWVASLAWACWIAATSTVAGAICAQRLAAGAAPIDRVDGTGPGFGEHLHRVLLAVASSVGAVVTVLLVAVPARTATGAQTFSPQTVAAGYAIVGLLVGLLVAVWALSSPAAAANLIATTCWLWLLAVIAVVDGVLTGRGLTSAQLGVWQIGTAGDRLWLRDNLYWPGALLGLGSALVIGILAARRAARRPLGRVGAAASGGAGPLLVAVAYFTAAPQLTGIRAEQLSAHLVAPYAVIAGLAGSMLMAALAQRAESRAAGAEARPAEPELGPPGRADQSDQPAYTPGEPDQRHRRPGRPGRPSPGAAGPGDDQTKAGIGTAGSATGTPVPATGPATAGFGPPEPAAGADVSGDRPAGAEAGPGRAAAPTGQPMPATGQPVDATSRPAPARAARATGRATARVPRPRSGNLPPTEPASDDGGAGGAPAGPTGTGPDASSPATAPPTDGESPAAPPRSRATRRPR